MQFRLNCWACAALAGPGCHQAGTTGSGRCGWRRGSSRTWRSGGDGRGIVAALVSGLRVTGWIGSGCGIWTASLARRLAPGIFIGPGRRHRRHLCPACRRFRNRLGTIAFRSLRGRSRTCTRDCRYCRNRIGLALW